MMSEALADAVVAAHGFYAIGSVIDVTVVLLAEVPNGWCRFLAVLGIVEFLGFSEPDVDIAAVDGGSAMRGYRGAVSDEYGTCCRIALLQRQLD
jgi:predicted alternative tryptophan synthase beta-subunit